MLPLNSQIQVAHLLEGQFGKLPQETVDAFPSVYDRAEISYKNKGWRANATIEQYHTTFDGRSYIDLSQAHIGYKKKRWTIKLGNFYETLGNGLLLRSFEFPGALLEDVGFRSRNYFHRDVLGASVKYKGKKWTFHGIYGEVLDNTLPPVFDRTTRRSNDLAALSSSFKYVKGHEAGIILSRHAVDLPNVSSNTIYNASFKANGKLAKRIRYFGEYAKNLTEDGYALYAGISGSVGKFSYTIEYKDYSSFLIGTGINEPPAAIKQQTYRTLNRSIHVSDPEEESGYQIDLFYNFDDGTVLNLNHSLARNPFGTETTIFQQYFFEIQSSLSEDFDYKAFIDYSIDPFKSEENRFSAGLYTDFAISPKLRLLPEIEYQTFDRRDSDIYNISALLGLKIDKKLFVSVLAETTDDPFIREADTSSKLFLGTTIRFTPTYQHTFQLFAGERRGGPQCTAGVCYEILDFQGIELRWVGRWKS